MGRGFCGRGGREDAAHPCPRVGGVEGPVIVGHLLRGEPGAGLAHDSLHDRRERRGLRSGRDEVK
eukprot:1764769-Pyramimonas_sp.AAC.1